MSVRVGGDVKVSEGKGDAGIVGGAGLAAAVERPGVLDCSPARQANRKAKRIIKRGRTMDLLIFIT